MVVGVWINGDAVTESFIIILIHFSICQAQSGAGGFNESINHQPEICQDLPIKMGDNSCASEWLHAVGKAPGTPWHRGAFCASQSQLGNCFWKMRERWSLVGGFNSSEKYESQLAWLFPIYGKIKNVPNHQSDQDIKMLIIHRIFLGRTFDYYQLDISVSKIWW